MYDQQLTVFQKAMMSILCIGIAFISYSQNTEVFDYVRNTSKEELRSSDLPEIEILLVGTFHFKTKLSVPDVESQIKNFNPDMLFVEEVPADEHQRFRSDLAKQRKSARNLYDEAIDSAIRFTGLSREEAFRTIEQLTLRKKLTYQERASLVNSLIITNNETNAFLHFYSAQKSMNEVEFQKFRSLLTPMHLNRTYCSGETKFLTIPIAISLHLKHISLMDFQKDRILNDSLLAITQKKLIPRQIWKIWQLPYFLKMMKLNKGPKDDSDAIRHFRILNKWKTIINMARLNEKLMNKRSVPESIHWNAIYRKRNEMMIKRVHDQSLRAHAKKIAIVVGASHVPYHIYEIKKQFKNASIELLNVKKL